MKKFIISIMLILISSVLLLTGCNTSDSETNRNTKSDKQIKEAIELLSEHWSDYYDKLEERWNNGHDEKGYKDKHLEIINTRIVYIKDNIESDKSGLFDDVDYIVEFELITNYYNSSPYYDNFNIDDCVVVYKDGTATVTTNLFSRYRSLTYAYDFSPIIKSIKDFNGKYDQVLDLE